MLIFLPGEVLRVRFVLVLIGCQCASYRRDDSFRCFSNSTAPKKNYFPLSLLVKYVPLIKVFFKRSQIFKNVKKERERVFYVELPASIGCHCLVCQSGLRTLPSIIPRRAIQLIVLVSCLVSVNCRERADGLHALCPACSFSIHT